MRKNLAEQVLNQISEYSQKEVLAALTNQVAELMKTIATYNAEGYADAFRSLSSELREMEEYAATTIHTIEVPEKSLETFRKISPIVPEPQREEFVKIISEDNSAQENNGKKLTFSDALALLNILLMVLSIILSMLPDKQLDQIIKQNDTQIEQNDMIIQYERDLVDALDSVVDGINLLSDQIDSIRDEFKNANDTPEVNSESNRKNSQEQNADTQQ